jgi:hypothetical protein
VVWWPIVSGLVIWGLVTVRVIVAWHGDLSPIWSFLDSKMTIPGENGSEQRTQVQNGGRHVKDSS